MPLHMEPGQIYNTWADFKEALDTHCKICKVVFNISNAKTVEQANSLLKKKPFFDIRLKYASCMLVCKHFGSYKSLSTGMRPKQRSYKINCRAFISVSACRKENYLIVRDSYHIHSHPCTDEIYNSYPEVRRMSKEERKMIGTLMELGVPTSQIKNAVGKHVTPKDLQNAKTHIKAVKLGLKSDEPKVGPRRRKTYKEIQAARREARIAAGLPASDSDDDDDEFVEESSSVQNSDSGDRIKIPRNGDSGLSRDMDSSNFTVTIGDINDHLEVGTDTLGGDMKDGAGGDMSGLSGLLAAAGISSESVVLTVNNQNPIKGVEDGIKSSYTVTVSLPEGDVTHSGTNLQELLKGLPLGKIIAKSSSTPSSPVKIKTEDDTVVPETKHCVKCGGYISPLDGHVQCLSCLGPDHIHESECKYCRAMTPEQFNIRRKKMVALRMKALKEMRRKRKQEDVHYEEQGESDYDFSQGVRKSKRIRKPKQYGPDIEVENSFVLGCDSSSRSLRKDNLSQFKIPAEDNEKRFPVTVPKTELLDDFDPNFSNETCEDKTDNKLSGWNTQRFEHILSQATVFEDVSLGESSSKSLCYIPEIQTFTEFQKLAERTDIPAIPSSLTSRYLLHPKFESMFCVDPEPLSADISDPSVEVMGTGLSKLARNAVVQTRVAVYDKLFTRLGVGMADEALSILNELYGKVTEVTEISQEDLTSSLQTALDTIQALKDVLEELGLMSKDALTTAAHQRNLSINSLNAARKSLKTLRAPASELNIRRGKFLPFSRTQISPRPSPSEQTLVGSVSHPTTEVSTVTSPAYNQKHFTAAISPAQLDASITDVPIMAIATTQEGLDDTSDATAAFINMSGKEFTMAPLTVSSELLQSLTTNKDGIIELHVLKDETELLGAEDATVEEVIHTD